MTHGEMLYLALVLCTFGGFGLGIGRASWHQTQQDLRARRETEAAQREPHQPLPT